MAGIRRLDVVARVAASGKMPAPPRLASTPERAGGQLPSLEQLSPELGRNPYRGTPPHAEAAQQDHAAKLVKAQLFQDMSRDDIVREGSHADLLCSSQVPRVVQHETQCALIESLPSRRRMYEAIEDN